MKPRGYAYRIVRSLGHDTRAWDRIMYAWQNRFFYIEMWGGVGNDALFCNLIFIAYYFIDE